jgi:hypothetical protein
VETALSGSFAWGAAITMRHRIATTIKLAENREAHIVIHYLF